MISYEAEIKELETAALLDAGSAERLMAIERRDVVSLHQQLRIAAWLAVSTIVTGVGLYIKDNYRHIGAGALITLLAIAALGCYAFAFTRQRKRGYEGVDEYVLLLGGLLLSGDVAFAESQYHLLDHNWSMHLLLLAVIHAAGAYFFESGMLLTLSITSLAGWFGVQANADTFFDSSAQDGTRALICATLLAIWRVANDRTRFREKFDGIFDQFIALLALTGALLWCFPAATKWIGLLLVLGLAAAGFTFARRTHQVSFALYALLAAYIAVTRCVLGLANGSNQFMPILMSLYFTISAPAMIVGIILLVRQVDRKDA